MKQTLTLRTDARGHFATSQVFDPPLLRDRTVALSVELREPAGVEVRGELDIDAVDGDPSNPARAFVGVAGREVSLGRWRIDRGQNSIVVRGTTVPPLPDADLLVELEVTLV